MLFDKIFSLKQEEFKLFLYAASFIFLLFASYAILRPLRDAFGIEGGDKEIKWLFLATFITTLLASLLAMWLSTRVKRKNYLNAIYLFFALNLLVFYIAMNQVSPHTQGFLVRGVCLLMCLVEILVSGSLALSLLEQALGVSLEHQW